MPQPRQTSVIQSKLRVPSLPDNFVQRPRLHRLIAELIEHRRIVVLSATAGAGKTTAVVSALALVGRPVVWLAVDRTDGTPGRLVTYLEAALAQRFPDVIGVTTGALAAGIPHAEVAGLLAEAVGTDPVVLVLDDLERLGEEREAWAVIEALLRYAPPTMSIALISRRELPPALCALPPGAAIAAMGEEELAFTPAEAAEALALMGKTNIDAAAAVEATGGWVTGVLFEAWRSEGHVVGGGGEADPLYGYLSSHILGQLEPADREFLVATSLLDEVTAPRAEALGLRRAGERLVALRAAHLPVSWDSEGRVMRCHSRFREYLQERFERLGEDEVSELRLAHGRQLAAGGLHEEAVEEFLRAGATEDALPSAETAVARVIERGDFAVAERWLEALADVASVGASPLTTGELLLAVAREDLRRVVRIADQLAALGERDGLAATSDTAVWTLTWGYISVVRPDDLRAVLAAAGPGPATDAARYGSQVMIDLDGGPVPRPALTGTPIDAFVYIADYALGNLAELVQEPGSRWMEAVKGQWRIAALRAIGRTGQALELYEAAEPGGLLSLQAWIGAEVLIDAGRGEDARAVLAHGRVLARESGQLASEGMNRLAAARLALRVDGDPAAARAVLDRPEHQFVASRFRFIGELTDTWQGLALLRESRDAEALTRLRRSVQGMVAGGRLLELPTAAVYLAEAEWRAGHEDAADAAADLALETARRQGSNHVLLQALADFPAVVSRRIDAEPSAASRWHELGRALIAQGVKLAATIHARVELQEFGHRAILVDGQEARPRIAKTYELLAFLATRRPPQARREELLEALFGGRTDESARAYLRQAVHWLRQLLPEGGIVVEGGQIRLSDEVEISSESMRFETALAEAARLVAGERITATLAALAIYDQGEYLPGQRSGWADTRQQELADLATDARYEAAELALAAGDYNRAQELASQVLSADPFREAAWRLAMRIADTLGDEKGITRAFHECERSLAELGTTPSPTTRQLLERLRR
jgi:DNA-binding SARP family transcriptional activator